LFHALRFRYFFFSILTSFLNITSDFNQFESLLNERELLNERLNHYERQYPHSTPKLNIFDAIRFRTYSPAVEFLNQRREIVEFDIKSILSLPLQSSGTAFITFESFKVARRFVLDAAGDGVHNHLNLVESICGSCDARTATEIMNQCAHLKCANWIVTKVNNKC
jgi:hypothetical protein